MEMEAKHVKDPDYIPMESCSPPRYVPSPPISSKPGGPHQDVWSTMSAGSMSLHSMGGGPVGSSGFPPADPVPPPAGGGGSGHPDSLEHLETEDYLEPTPPLQSPPLDPGYKHRSARDINRSRAHDSGVADIDGVHLAVDNNMNGLVQPRMPGDPHITDRMRRPDSLAVRGHEYEELPSARYHTRYPYADMEDNSSRSGSGGSRPLPMPIVNDLKSGHIHNDSSDSLCRPLSGTSSNGGVQNNERFSNTYRKRENPLYDEGDPDDLQEKPSKPSGLLACPCAGIFVIGLLAVIAFLLAILMVVGTFNPKKEVALAPETAALVQRLNQTDLIMALQNMRRLEDKYNNLLHKYNSVEAALNLTQLNNATVATRVESNTKAIEFLLSGSGINLPTAHTLVDKMDQYDKIEKKQNESIADIYSKYEILQLKLEQLNTSVRQELSSLRNNVSITESRITRIEMDFGRRLNTIGTNLTNQIQIVRKQEGPKGDRGPPGPAGAGNLSKCEYYYRRSGSASPASTSTDWWPTDKDDIEQWVIMGTECSTENGETALLEVQQHPQLPYVDQFRCVCRGSSGGGTSRFCKLNVWRCPKAS